MKIYHYDKHTNEYTHTTEANKDPVSGDFVVSAMATITPAPTNITKNCVAVFTEDTTKERLHRTGTWKEVRDFRGIVYDKVTLTPETWETLDPLPSNLTHKVPPVQESKWDNTLQDWVLDLAKVKVNKIQQASDAHQAANAAPVTYKRVVYQADRASKDALAAKVNAVQAGWVVPKSFQWKALDNTLHVFKAADVKALYLAIETRNQTNWAHYQSLKKRINACTTQKELDAIKV